MLPTQNNFLFKNIFEIKAYFYPAASKFIIMSWLIIYILSKKQTSSRGKVLPSPLKYWNKYEDRSIDKMENTLSYGFHIVWLSYIMFWNYCSFLSLDNLFYRFHNAKLQEWWIWNEILLWWVSSWLCKR